MYAFVLFYVIYSVVSCTLLFFTDVYYYTNTCDNIVCSSQDNKYSKCGDNNTRGWVISTSMWCHLRNITHLIWCLGNNTFLVYIHNSSHCHCWGQLVHLSTLTFGHDELVMGNFCIAKLQLVNYSCMKYILLVWQIASISQLETHIDSFHTEIWNI